MAKKKSTDLFDQERQENECRLEDLKQALDLIRPAVADKSIVEGMTHFIFGQDQDQWVAGYDDEMCALVILDDVRDLDLSVEAGRFYKLLSAGGDACSLVVEKDQLKVTSGQREAGLNYMEPGEVRKMVDGVLDDAEGDVYPMPKGFVEALALCSFYASKDMTLSDITGVRVKGTTMLSTDKLRISRFDLEDDVEESELNFMVPATSAIKLLRYQDWLTHFQVTQKWLHMESKDGAVAVSIRLMSGDFPDQIMDYFPKKKEQGFELPKEIVDALDASMLFLEDKFLSDKEIKMSLQDGELTVSVQNQSAGWFTERVGVEGAKGEFDIVTNPVFMKEILRHALEIIPYPDKDMVMFRSGNFQHLISLV